MRITDTSDLWWKTAVIYCLDVETFLDWNDDGRGDFIGLAQRIDYLAELGVTCLWLMPFYPTPDRDDGYDITDFYGVDRHLGTHGDLVEVIRTARDRGMRVIADLVVNHTSDQHPWFRSARSSKDSPYRDWYVWRDQPPRGSNVEPVFPDQETSAWELDAKTKQYYLHRFYRHQPDLNVTNPVVRDEIVKILGFWLELGLSGFRVDAVPFLLETLGTELAEEDLPDPHDFLRALRAFLGRRSGDGILLGEVNLPHEQQREFFGGDDGDELTMLFDFIGMQKLYLSLARGDAGPLAEALFARPAVSPDCQWATFVRNHDELTLDKLTDEERGEVFAAFGPEPQMQIYGRGLTRRLPPMLGGDPRRIKNGIQPDVLPSGNSSAFLRRGNRNGGKPRRRRSQRGADPDAVDVRPQRRVLERQGFRVGRSRRRGRVLTRARQRGRPAHRPRLAVALHGVAHPALPRLPRTGLGRVLGPRPAAYLRPGAPMLGEATLVALHNLGPEPRTVPLVLGEGAAGRSLVGLLDTGTTPLGEDGRAEIVLDGYLYRWLRLVTPGDRRLI